MRSIRLSLVVYFLVLVAVAVGAVSVLAYRTAHETLEAKKKLLPQAVREGWLCLFYHDPDAPLCRVIEEKGKLRAVESQS